MLTKTHIIKFPSVGVRALQGAKLVVCLRGFVGFLSFSRPVRSRQQLLQDVVDSFHLLGGEAGFDGAVADRDADEVLAAEPAAVARQPVPPMGGIHTPQPGLGEPQLPFLHLLDVPEGDFLVLAEGEEIAFDFHVLAGDFDVLVFEQHWIPVHT